MHHDTTDINTQTKRKMRKGDEKGEIGKYGDTRFGNIVAMRNYEEVPDVDAMVSEGSVESVA